MVYKKCLNVKAFIKILTSIVMISYLQKSKLLESLYFVMFDVATHLSYTNVNRKEIRILSLKGALQLLFIFNRNDLDESKY